MNQIRGGKTESKTWAAVARRIRVPAGFVFAALYLWAAQPRWISLAPGAIVTCAGLWLRASASGHLDKNLTLTTTGPYAYTRNPLYLGSILIGLGFAVASLSPWVWLGLLLMFTAIYLPVIRGEEVFLRQRFPGYEDYFDRVPVLMPRLRAAGSEANARGGAFSCERYLRHREYNALIGAAAMMLALILKIIWQHKRVGI